MACHKCRYTRGRKPVAHGAICKLGQPFEVRCDGTAAHLVYASLHGQIAERRAAISDIKSSNENGLRVSHQKQTANNIVSSALGSSEVAEEKRRGYLKPQCSCSERDTKILRHMLGLPDLQEKVRVDSKRMAHGNVEGFDDPRLLLRKPISIV